MSIKIESVEIIPQHVIGGQSFLMAVQVSIVEGMQLAMATFDSADEGWVQVDDKFNLDIVFSGQVFPLLVYEDAGTENNFVSNVDMSFVEAAESTTVTLRSYEKFNGVLGVLKK